MTKLARARWQALGTSVELVVLDGHSSATNDGHTLATGDHQAATASDLHALTQARAILERQLDEIDRTCSRFREDSELMRVNARPGCSVRVDPLLIDAVELALRAAELTDGDVDPTVGAALLLAGYDGDMQPLGCISPATWDPRRATPHKVTPYTKTSPIVSYSPHTQESRVRATMLCGWRSVELDRERSTLRIPRGVRLDLGATAKAWAADRAALAIHRAIGCGVLVSLGGDISTAGPAPGGRDYLEKAQTGWPIHVTDDHRSGSDAPGQTISIAGSGLATSSTTVRRWRHGEQTMHHIIDPSSGTPAEEVWRTVSVAAINCADANIAATAAIVRGARAPEWLAELGLPARLVDRDGYVTRVGEWPCEGETAPLRATAKICA
jgi:thiamine biosynthesis lipoprotein